MSRLRPKHFSLGIGAEDIAIADVAESRLLTTLPLLDYLTGANSPATADWTALIEAVLAQTGEAKGGELTWTVSDAWVRYFMLSVPGGVGSLAELQALAAGRFESLFGTPPTGWQLVADWQASGNIMICALPERLVEVAHTLEQTGTWRIRSIQPYTMRLFNQFQAQIPADCWLCGFAPHGVVAVLLEAGAVRHVRRFLFDGELDAEVVQTHLIGEMFRLGVTEPRCMCTVGMLPEMPTNGRVGKLKLVVPQSPKALIFQPATTEAAALAQLGGLA